MDAMVGQLALGIGASIAGAGMVMSGGWAGYTPVGSDGGLRPSLVHRWCWPLCPPLFGAILAAIVILVYRDALDPQAWVLTTGVIGGLAGAAGATVSLCIQSLGPK